MLNQLELKVTLVLGNREIINEKIQELFEADLIEPALHPTWSTPVMLVKKPRSDKLTSSGCP